MSDDDLRERTPLPVRPGQGSGLLLWGFDYGVQAWVLARWLPAGVQGPVPEAYAWIDAGLLTDLPGVQRYRMHLDHGLPARAFDGPPETARTFTCPDCWQVTRHPDDVTNRYCPSCHWPTDSRDQGAPPAGRARPRWQLRPGLRRAEWSGRTREGLRDELLYGDGS